MVSETRRNDVKVNELVATAAELKAVNFISSDSTAPTSDDSQASSVQVKLETPGIAFEVNTHVATNNQIVDLSARLDLVLTLLSQSQGKLESALKRIGFLEAQVLQRDQIIDRLCRHNSN
jgi:hypothetical protein